MFNKQGLGRIPRKEKDFNRNQINLAHLLANLESKILISWRKATYIIWDNQSWFRQTSTPLPQNKSHRICVNFMGGPRRGWGGLRSPWLLWRFGYRAFAVSGPHVQTWESTPGSRLASIWTSEVESSRIHLLPPPVSSSAITSRLLKNWSKIFWELTCSRTRWHIWRHISIFNDI